MASYSIMEIEGIGPSFKKKLQKVGQFGRAQRFNQKPGFETVLLIQSVGDRGNDFRAQPQQFFGLNRHILGRRVRFIHDAPLRPPMYLK